MICTCTGRSFTAVNDWWVCAKCLHPYELYLEKRMSDEGVTFNLFQGGSHHNEIWSVQELLNDKQEPEAQNVAAWITEYRWTDEVITGSESGRKARVWVVYED